MEKSEKQKSRKAKKYFCLRRKAENQKSRKANFFYFDSQKIENQKSKQYTKMKLLTVVTKTLVFFEKKRCKFAIKQFTDNRPIFKKNFKKKNSW